MRTLKIANFKARNGIYLIYLFVIMRTKLMGFSLLIIISLITGCTDHPILSESRHVNETFLDTKTSNATNYYWYRGEKIPLTTNLEYVNVLLSDPGSIKSDIDELLSEYGLVLKNGAPSNGLMKVRFRETPSDKLMYDSIVSKLREDERICGVYPFFEQGRSHNPIGTSDTFYVRLKGDGQDELPIEARSYDTENLVNLAAKHGLGIIGNVPYVPGWYALSIKGSSINSTIDAANLFYESSLFRDTDPAFCFEFAFSNIPNDPLYSQQWSLNDSEYGYDINVEGAWDITTGTGRKIAILDGQVDNSHVDLQPNCTYLYYDIQPSTASDPYQQYYDHGTRVAGIMVAKGDNNVQLTGVAYDSKLIRVRTPMSFMTTSAQLASGINFAWTNGADVINCSWSVSSQIAHSAILENALDDALTSGRSHKGTVIVFSAGNSAGEIGYPANWDDRILTVGSIGRNGIRSSFSAYGEKLDVVAPGEDIISTLPDNSTGMDSGTSFAAPHVSGLAALILSTNPDLSREEVVRLIEMTARKISPGGVYSYYQYTGRYNGLMNLEVGYGLIDAASAVRIARDSHATPSSGSPGMEFFIAEGSAAQYDNWYVMGPSYQNSTVYFTLETPQINPSYTYFWHFTTSGSYGWSPSFNYVGNDSTVSMNIPRPNSDSVLNISCEVYNGSTHVTTANFALTVRLNFP